MITFSNELTYKYLPILAISPAEMGALGQLPEKDKDLILPLFPIKGWMSAKKLDNALAKINESIGNRIWIADIDTDFLYSNKSFKMEGAYSREVFEEIHKLLDSSNGYKNWFDFLQTRDNIIPTLQLEHITDINIQLDLLSSLERGIVIRFQMTKIEPKKFNSIIRSLLNHEYDNYLFILDYADIGRVEVVNCSQYSELINKMKELFPNSMFSISSTSFPFSFAGAYRGEIPIYERQIYRNIKRDCNDINLIYSDRGSARAGKYNGGGGTPPPRIDYPLKNDWRFIRKEFDGKNITKPEKEKLYFEAAREIIKSDYWIKDLGLWGTQMIEKTALEDTYGITCPNRSTAVRINIHLYQQLHYNDIINELNTDEEWED